VLQPTRQRLSFSVDYWAITKRDLISTLGDDVILGNLAKYEPLVHRYNEDEGLPGCDYDPDDNASASSSCARKTAAARRPRAWTSRAELKGLKTDWASFGVQAQFGTLALVSSQQTGYGDPYVSNLGRFVTDGVVQRWRHRLTLDWERVRGAHA
jgi:iron complex outermembrane receptor protein